VDVVLAELGLWDLDVAIAGAVQGAHLVLRRPQLLSLLALFMLLLLRLLVNYQQVFNLLVLAHISRELPILVLDLETFAPECPQ